MSATGQPTEGAPPAETPAESAAPEAPPTTEPSGFDRLATRMDEMAAEQRTFMESVTQQLQPPEFEEEEPEFYDDTGELTEAGARQIITDLVSEQVDARLAPREAQRLVEQRDDAYEALKDEYPDLSDDKIARRVLDKAVAWAHQSGNEKLIEHPAFVDVIESFYKADKFDELRANPSAELPRPVVLESASGATRERARPPEIDWQERVIKAAEADGPRI